MRSIRPNAAMFLVLGLMFGLTSGASAQVTFVEMGPGGCFVNPTTSTTDCAKATFSLMTGGSAGSPGSVIGGTSASNVTGLQILIQNTTPTTVTNYGNADLLLGFFWGLTNSPTLATTTTTTGKVTSTSYNGSALATNSLGGQAIINPTQCSTVVVCQGTSVDVGAYWAGSYKLGGWTGSPGTFAGAYAVAASGFGAISLGHGNNIGATAPTLLAKNGNSLDFGLLGGAGITPTTGKPAIQDILTVQVAFATPLPSLNLNIDILASNVYFAYGTNPDSASGAKKAPEPASIALFGVGVMALGWARRRKRRQ